MSCQVVKQPYLIGSHMSFTWMCIHSCVHVCQCQLEETDISAELYLPAIDITSPKVHCSAERITCCSHSVGRYLTRPTKAVTTNSKYHKYYKYIEQDNGINAENVWVAFGQKAWISMPELIQV